MLEAHQRHLGKLQPRGSQPWIRNLWYQDHTGKGKVDLGQGCEGEEGEGQRIGVTVAGASQQALTRRWGNGIFHTLLMGKSNGAATVENKMLEN